MTGIPAVDVFVIAGIIAGGLGLVGVIGRAGKWMLRTIRRVQNFLDDWNGEPARPGVEARPGFPDRLAALEVEVAAVRKLVSNGLSSNVADIQARVTRVEERLNGGQD